MQKSDNKPRPKSQAKISTLGAALDAAERDFNARRARGDVVDHIDFDFVDIETGELEHDRAACPACKLRDLERAYRAEARKPVIARAHKPDRRVAPVHKIREAWHTTAHRYAPERVLTTLPPDTAAKTMHQLFGDIPQTRRQRIDLAVKIERMDIDHDEAMLRAITRRRDGIVRHSARKVWSTDHV